MPVKYKKPIAPIKASKIGSLEKIADKEGGLLSNGKVSRTWARKKLKDKGSSNAVKKKLLFFLNMNKG